MTSVSASPTELVRRETDAGVVTLTLAQSQNRNALGLAMIDTLIVAFADIAKDPARAPSSSPARARRSAPATICARSRRTATTRTAAKRSTNSS